MQENSSKFTQNLIGKFKIHYQNLICYTAGRKMKDLKIRKDEH